MLVFFQAYLVFEHGQRKKKESLVKKEEIIKDRGEMRHVSATSWVKIEPALVSFWEIMIFSHICLLSLIVRISAVSSLKGDFVIQFTEY